MKQQSISTETVSPAVPDLPLLECAPPVTEALSGSLSLIEDVSTITVPQSEALADNVSEFERLFSCVEHCLSDVTISEDMREAFNQILLCLSEIGALDFAVRSALPKLVENKLVKKWLRLVNKCLHMCMQNQYFSFTQCNCLVYAGSAAVARLSGQCNSRGRK